MHEERRATLFGTAGAKGTKGQVRLRRIDGWQKMAAMLSRHPTVAA